MSDPTITEPPGILAGELASAIAEQNGFYYTLLTPGEEAMNTVVIKVTSDGPLKGRRFRISVEEEQHDE